MARRGASRTAERVKHPKAAAKKFGAWVSSGIANLDAKLEDIEDAADSSVKLHLDKARKLAIQKVLTMAGKEVRSALKPAYMPKQLCRMADALFDHTWPEVSR